MASNSRSQSHLRRLKLLGDEPHSPSPQPAPHPAGAMPDGDDRALEALLADDRDPCMLQQLAGALQWTLDRIHAARRPARSASCEHGHTLQRHGHHTLALRARTHLIAPDAKGRRRHASGPIDLATARVLYRILTANRDQCTWDDVAAPDEIDGGPAPDRRRLDRGVRLRATTDGSLRRDLRLQPPLGAAARQRPLRLLTSRDAPLTTACRNH